MTDNPTHSNRLAQERSPYLLQHAHNPVDWYPWGEEALQKAKEEDKPIIVSIGYSACHWCHVMERESFEHPGLAAMMNRDFVCIKVDREERPDVDQIYMDAVHAMGLQGGWPLNVFLLPDQRPFYGGTYFPPARWSQVLQGVAKAYKEQKEELEKSAQGFLQTLSASEVKKYGLVTSDSDFTLDLAHKAVENLSKVYDKEHGGTDRAPKFPMPSLWHFLLDYARITGQEEATQHLHLTLDEMARGGIYDQIGGGFARYSVDERWLVPHFEKMAYDNGQLLSLYADAYRRGQRALYGTVIRETVAFAEKELLAANGGFFSALDADSEGEEGKFYCWSYAEFERIMSNHDADLIADYWNLTEEGNWEEGKNILHRVESDEAFAEKHGITLKELEEKVSKAKRYLMFERILRVRPGTDDKILAGWNALLVKGIADAYAATGEEHFFDLACRQADFLLVHMSGPHGLWRNFTYDKEGNGRASITAYLEDYALVIEALIAVWQISQQPAYLEEAAMLCNYTLEHFYDKEEGFFFYTDAKSEALIARKKEIFDNVIPASNSVMARNLLRLGALLDKPEWKALSEEMMRRMMRHLGTDVQYLGNWGRCYLEHSMPLAEVVIVGPEAALMTKKLLSRPLHNVLVMANETPGELSLFEGKVAINGKTTLYVCFDKACQLPVHSASEAIDLIKKGQKGKL